MRGGLRTSAPIPRALDFWSRMIEGLRKAGMPEAVSAVPALSPTTRRRARASACAASEFTSPEPIAQRRLSERRAPARLGRPRSISKLLCGDAAQAIAATNPKGKPHDRHLQRHAEQAVRVNSMSYGKLVIWQVCLVWRARKIRLRHHRPASAGGLQHRQLRTPRLRRGSGESPNQGGGASAHRRSDLVGA